MENIKNQKEKIKIAELSLTVLARRDSLILHFDI